MAAKAATGLESSEVEEIQSETESTIEGYYKEQTDTGADSVLHLTRPIKYNGEEISELTFDFDKLTGADALNIEAQLYKAGELVTTSALYNVRYLILMAAKACTINVGLDFFERLSIADFQKVRGRAFFYLLGAGR